MSSARLPFAEAMKRANVAPGDVSEVILGQILSAAEGQNPARQAAVAAGIPFEVTAYGINQLCGSGLRAVALGFQAIRNGDSEIVVAGGQESMSMAPHAMNLRNGVKMGNATMVDTMIVDALWDAFNGYHMGNTAENVARKLADHRASSRMLSRRKASRRTRPKRRRRPAGSRTKSSR